MKRNLILTAILFAQIVSFGQSEQTSVDSSKACFYIAFDALKNMLEGKDSLNYEKAVFITENAYYNNAFDYNVFEKTLDMQASLIDTISENARKDYLETHTNMKLYEQKMLVLNAKNWAIFKYITDTTLVFFDHFIYYNEPYNYSADDPYGSTKWENTQVLHLLTGSEAKGNCYALSVLFKIFSDRLKSDARLTVAPHHIYIQNRNGKGDFYNVELAARSFPGDGSIQTLTYTTKTSIMNGMAQRMLTNKEAVALNLIYLAKGYEHKFNDNTNDFLLQCAELAFKHDTLSLNALLLKAEITENRLFKAMQENKITTLAQVKKNTKTKELLTSYEKQLSNLYKCGYREIPKDIQRIIYARINHTTTGVFLQDKTPNPFKEIGANQRYATLSGGLFDEMHENVDSIEYNHALLNTTNGKIIRFLPFDSTLEYKADPVVFAWSVDPLAAKYPNLSPYVAFADNPIFFVDTDGRDIFPTTDFKKSNYNKAHLYLMDNNSVYKELLSKYENSPSFNLYLGTNDKNIPAGRGGYTIYTYKSKLFNGKETSTSAETKEDFASSQSSGDITLWTFYIEIHEATHAFEPLNPAIAKKESKKDPSLYGQNDHEAFSALIDKTISSFAELSKDLNLGWSSDQIKEVSLYGTENSKMFKEYIKGLSTTNQTTFKEEKGKYTTRVKDLLSKTVEIPSK